MTATDPRRHVPRTDVVLDDPRLAPATAALGRALVKQHAVAVLDACRRGDLAPEDVVPAVGASLPPAATSLRPVVNATGVLVHTNLGRAPLSEAAVSAVTLAAGTNDVELDLVTGRRGRRGRGALAALATAVPDAEAVHVVNNGAAAVALVATALAGAARGSTSGTPEVVVARGEMVEIGDGFRIPDLVESTGARLREVGTTNRVRPEDYLDAVGPSTAFVLKVHPSNFRVEGFTSHVPVGALAARLRGAGHDVPVVADLGSGLLRPHPRLPDEPDAASTLREGADLVIASGDKLLGGPQAGLLLGRADLVERARRHPLARAVRVDKLTLAALEATLTGPAPPVARALATDAEDLLRRAHRLAAALHERATDAAAIALRDAHAVRSAAAVGGGGAPGVELPSAALSLPASLAPGLRQGAAGAASVLGRTVEGRLLLDLFAVRPEEDEALLAAVLAAASSGAGPG